MRVMTWIVAPLLTLAFSDLPARAGDSAGTAPALLVRVKSIDSLIADAKYLAGLAGKGEQADQFEKMIPALLGPKGVAETGLDSTRPLGAYGVLNPQLPMSQAVILIPVADETAFVKGLRKAVDFIPNGNVKVDKGEDGIYTVTVPNLPFGIQGYFTIADGYAYVTAGRKESIEAGKRLPAAKLLTGGDQTVLSITIRIDQIDPGLKQAALGHLENQMADAKEKKEPNETAAQTKLKAEVIDHVFRRFQILLTDGKSFDFRVTLDRKTDDASVQVMVTPKPNTPLATEIGGETDKPSRFGPMTGAIAQGMINVAFPADLRAGFVTVMEEGFKDAQSKQKDATKRDLAQKLFDALVPTFKAGQLDVFGCLIGPNATGKYTLTGGIKVQDASRIEKTVRELVAQIPDPKAKAAVTLDAETVGGTKAHRFIPYDMDADGRRVFGDQAKLLFAFPPDAVVVAFGADPAVALGHLIESSGKAGGPLRAEASIAKLAAMDPNNGTAAKTAAAAAFGGDKNAEMVRFSVEGGQALRLRLWLKAKYVTFATKMEEARAGQ
jgi:hypothetical protein